MKLSEAIKILEAAGIDNPRYDATELFRAIGKIDRTALIFPDTDCSSPLLSEAIERRRRREPLQYIIGEVDFYRESYKVTPDCLIPRQDTEILVDYAVKNIPRGAHFLDLCTGCGCIALSTLKNTEKTTATAVDVSSRALDVARLNADKNGVSDRVRFILGDVLKSPLSDGVFAVLSNPPYIPRIDYEKLQPEIYFEPEIAFVGGEDGMVFYERITELYKDKILPDGFIAYEIGYDQADKISAVAEKHAMRCEIIKDYSGNCRVAVLKNK